MRLISVSQPDAWKPLPDAPVDWCGRNFCFLYTEICINVIGITINAVFSIERGIERFADISTAIFIIGV